MRIQEVIRSLRLMRLKRHKVQQRATQANHIIRNIFLPLEFIFSPNEPKFFLARENTPEKTVLKSDFENSHYFGKWRLMVHFGVGARQKFPSTIITKTWTKSIEKKNSKLHQNISQESNKRKPDSWHPESLFIFPRPLYSGLNMV